MLSIIWQLQEDAKYSPLPKSSSPLPESTKVPPLLEPSPAARQENLDEIAKKDKARLVELLKNKGGRTGSCPNFTVSVKGPKVGGYLYI